MCKWYSSVRGRLSRAILFFGSTQVACRQLGFLGAKRFYTHGGGTGPTWLDDVNCRGTEKSLLDCKHRGIGVENCGKHMSLVIIVLHDL